jgi:transposase
MFVIGVDVHKRSVSAVAVDEAGRMLDERSGKSQRHRLDRGGNRQLNAALYRIAITQSRYHPAARAYLERNQAEGKSRREAIRCLKRLLARAVFNALKADPALT